MLGPLSRDFDVAAMPLWMVDVNVNREAGNQESNIF